MANDRKCRYRQSCGYDFCMGEGTCPEFERGKLYTGDVGLSLPVKAKENDTAKYDFRVNLKLQDAANETETFFDFIRDSEKEFNLPTKLLEPMNIMQLEAYIDFLDELWNK